MNKKIGPTSGIVSLLALLSILCAPGVALAVPMTWSYSGACTLGDCDIVSSISGTISGDPAILPPANELTDAYLFGELTSYSFNIGGYVFDGNDAVGSYELDASGNIVGGVMVFENIVRLELLGVGSAWWSIVDEDIVCRFLILCGTKTAVAAYGTGGYTLATAIPEPGILTLLGAGMLLIALTRRRRLS